MLLPANVVGNQQDWAQYITTADEHKCPLLKLIPKGDKPVNRLHQYQVDAYTDPTPKSWPDGKDVDSYSSAGQNRGELKARVQKFVQTAAVSLMAQDVTNAAGVNDELAREIKKKLFEMSRDIECSFASDQAALEDDGVTADKFQGLGLWLQNGTTSQLYPVPTTPVNYTTPSSSVYSDTKANLNENAVRAVLEARWLATGKSETTLALVCGSQLKQRFGTFQFYIPSDLSTVASSRPTNRNQGDTALSYGIDFYNSEFGNFELHLTKWNAHPNYGGTAGKSTWRGYAISPNMFEWRWNTMPTVWKEEFKGGSYKAAAYSILMGLCKSPLDGAKFAPSDA